MTPSSSTAESAPAVPAPVPVRLDARTTALLVMDVADPICTNRPSCVASVPRIAALLADARAGGAHVIYTAGLKLPTTILDPVAPLEAEPVVRARANKFHGSELDELLRERGVRTLLLVGTAANGAVMYTAFAANLRGYTVAVAVDAISSDDERTTRFVEWQLVHQPGFTNPANEPLSPERVTLTRTDLVRFADAES
jgi:nicotinamidase-related amidase